MICLKSMSIGTELIDNHGGIMENLDEMYNDLIMEHSMNSYNK